MASLSLSEQELKVNDNMKVPSKMERDEKIQQIRIGFINRLHLNRPWAYGLGFCEVINFMNTIIQIYVTDWFLGGAFLGLGQAVVEPLPKDKTDPLDIVFPKVLDHSLILPVAYDNLNARQRQRPRPCRSYLSAGRQKAEGLSVASCKLRAPRTRTFLNLAKTCLRMEET